MKRHRGLYSAVCSFENLLAASLSARRRKRSRRDVEEFEFDLERNLHQLCTELRERKYEPGELQDFWIMEPKRRLISKSPYRDRVVHHALCRVIEPIFERTFIYDSYASRAGKGTHAAIRRYQEFSRRHRYVLKCDIRRFFPSIDHGLLMERVSRKIADRDVLWLIEKIVSNSPSSERVPGFFPGDDLFTQTERARGLPVGNQTSQFLANVFLSSFDHFVKEELRRACYVRYVDDFVILGDSTTELRELMRKLEEFLWGLRLWLHPQKRVISRVEDGIRFLGYRVFPDHCRLPQQNALRFRRRLRRMQREFAAGRMDLPEIRQRIMAWLGHAGRASSGHLLRRLLSCKFTRGNSVDQSRVAWRLVQQQPGQPPVSEPQQQLAR
jgi:retron-type reverse transcriptase